MSSMLHITPKVSVYIYIYLYICVDIHGTSSIFKASGFDMAQLMLLAPCVFALGFCRFHASLNEQKTPDRMKECSMSNVMYA